MHRHKPPFPPAPYQVYRQRRIRQLSSTPSETSRLLPGTPPRLYTDSVSPSAPLVVEEPPPIASGVHVPDVVPVVRKENPNCAEQEEELEEPVCDKSALLRNSPVKM